MRKGVAVICLLTFFVLQYGKVVSYWQCRLSADTEAVLCECEKYLLDTHKEGTPYSAAAVIAKEKAEETYCTQEPIQTTFNIIPVTRIFSSFVLMFIPDEPAMNIFQPPRPGLALV